MCGIVGIVGDGSEKQIRKMTETIHHRGPDDDGFLIQPYINTEDNINLPNQSQLNKTGVYLGMRRLAVIDLETGKQPIYNEDDSVGVIYNGEIYNYIELKKQLEEKGHTFSTNSDTEVIVHLYEEYGEDCFTHLNGMFAIALWDFQKNKLVLGRDRTGEKPLFYAQLNDTLYFSSELKVFQTQLNITNQKTKHNKIDYSSLLKFIDQTYIPGNDTIFSLVKKLGAGEYLVYENKSIAINSYWQLPQVSNKKSEESLEQKVEELDLLLSDAVRMRLVSDVSLGVFLSGGLDSSLITHYAQEHSDQKIKTFTIRFDDASFNEATYASVVAKHLGTEHIEAHVSDKEVLSVIDYLPQIMDEPFADTSIIPTYWLAKKTREHVTVALSGDGSDELFMGYHTFNAWSYWKHLRRQPKFLHTTLSTFANMLPSSPGYFSFDFKLKRALNNFDKHSVQQHFRWFSPFSNKELCRLFNTNVILNNDCKKYLDYDFANMSSSRNPSIDSAMLYQKFYLTDDIFTKSDRASSAVSLETRAPFVDHRIIDFANKLPKGFKYKNGETKYILKKLAEKYIPEEIIYRPKHGFSSPVDTWLRGPLKERVEELFTTEELERLELFNAHYIQTIWYDFLQGNHYRARQIWTLFVWQLWSKHYIQ